MRRALWTLRKYFSVVSITLASKWLFREHQRHQWRELRELEQRHDSQEHSRRCDVQWTSGWQLFWMEFCEQVLWHKFYCFIHCYTFDRVQSQRHIVWATLVRTNTRAIHLFFDSKVFHFTIVLVIIVVILAFTKLNCFGRQTHSSQLTQTHNSIQFTFPVPIRQTAQMLSLQKSSETHFFSLRVLSSIVRDSIRLIVPNSAIAQYPSMGWR